MNPIAPGYPRDPSPIAAHYLPTPVRLVLAVIVFAAVHAAAFAVVDLMSTYWFGWLDGSRADIRLGAPVVDVLVVFTAIATLSNLAAWIGRSAVINGTAFRKMAAVQALAAVLSVAVQITLTAAFWALPRQLDSALVIAAVCWWFLGPALITRAVVRVLAGPTARPSVR